MNLKERFCCVNSNGATLFLLKKDIKNHGFLPVPTLNQYNKTIPAVKISQLYAMPNTRLDFFPQ